MFVPIGATQIGETSATGNMDLIESDEETQTFQIPNPLSTSDKTSKEGPWFTFDDIPIYKRRDRMAEISAWVDL